MAPQLTYDGTTSLSHFLHELYDRCYPQTPSAWIKAVYCRLEGEALEWAKKDENVVRIYYNAYHNVAIDRDGRRLYQLLENRFATPLHRRVDRALKGIKQQDHESIEDYYERVKTLFEHVGGQDRSISQLKDGEMRSIYLDWEHSFCLLKVIGWFADGLRNVKLRRNMVDTLQNMPDEDRSIISLHTTCIAAQLKRTMAKRTRKLRNQLFGTDTSIFIDMSQSSLEETTCDLPEISTSIYPPAHTSKPWLTQNWRARPLSEASIVNESPPIQEKNTCSLSESCIVDITNTPGKSVASESINRSAVPMSFKNSSPEASIVDESPPVLEQMPCDSSEINAAIVDSSDAESVDEILASGPRKWPAHTTTLPETSTVHESPPVLEQMPCKISEISTATEDISDIESVDEILASELRKWAAPTAEKEVFDSTSTSASVSKNPLAPDIEEDIAAVEAPSNKAPIESIVDMETPKEEVFECISISDQALKNPPASYSEDIEISAAMDMPSHEHLTNEDGSTTETFDSDTALGAPSKNPSIQHIENPETMEKDSVYIYELPALPAFDLSIDIDFEAYTIDSALTNSVNQAPVTLPRRKMQLSPFRGLALRNTSFGWSRSSTSSISRRTSSISTCTTVSDVTLDSIETANTVNTADIDFCEGEQSSCSLGNAISTINDRYSVVSASVECVVSEHSDFYGGEQFCSPVDTVDIVEIVDVVVTRADALTLTAGMVKKKDPAWMSLLGLILLLAWAWIEYLVASKHKGLPKVKIKRLSEPEHIEPRSQIIAGIPAKSAYKMALFSGIGQRLGSLR